MGSRGRPRDPSLDARILAEARRLLLERGVLGFSLLEVAARVGIPKSTVYRRWASQRALLLAAVEGIGTPEALAMIAVLQELPEETRAAIHLGLDIAIRTADPELAQLFAKNPAGALSTTPLGAAG